MGVVPGAGGPVGPVLDVIPALAWVVVQPGVSLVAQACSLVGPVGCLAVPVALAGALDVQELLPAGLVAAAGDEPLDQDARAALAVAA
ncbi:hypothetical protein KEM60_00366 [Austwickia sp. TVS 96-490-7B]|nr:hypothetical protein [Austwickia sp. TVS 96-490-7B]